MAEFTAKMGDTDEDGMRNIVILCDGVEIDRQYMRYDIASQWTSQELGILRSFDENPGECDHGLSAALCTGPMHY